MVKFKTLKPLHFFLVIVTFFCQNSFCQNNVIVKFYDSTWVKTSEDSAFYFTKFEKQDSFYKCTSYWMRSKQLNCKSIYNDTLFSKAIGLLLRYYEDGHLKDSTYYKNGILESSYTYYQNGHLWAHFLNDLDKKKIISEGFDESGKKIDNFIYMKEAEFPGGDIAWRNFLSENIDNRIPVKKGAQVGTYQVIIRFNINKDGKISDIYPETNLGYGMEKEVIRVIKKSPSWHPLILMEQPKIAFRRQPVTFVVAK